MSINMSTLLRKLMDAYCSSFGVDVALASFMIDGERLEPDDTVAMLAFANDDVIDIVLAQCPRLDARPAPSRAKLRSDLLVLYCILSYCIVCFCSIVLYCILV